RYARRGEEGGAGRRLMNDTGTILVVDDLLENVDLIEAILSPRGYTLRSAGSGEDALEAIGQRLPGLVLLDPHMPRSDGVRASPQLGANPETRFLPVVMVTAHASEERVKAIEAGADDFLAKPFDQAELLARVRSLLRIKRYHDTIQAQTEELGTWNRTHEQRVTAQVDELERVGRLKRFLPPQLVELVLTSGDESFLTSHR